MQYIMTNLAASIRQLTPDRELCMGSRYFNYCQLRPAATAADRFLQMVIYLMRNSSVCIVSLSYLLSIYWVL